MTEPLRILVVDDNEDLLKTLSLVLKRSGFDVEMATDGYLAVDRYMQGDYNITLMDVDMPGLNGIEALRLIREQDPAASVILMTGHSDDDLIKLAIDEGAHCVLFKPMHIDKILNTIKAAVPPLPDSNKDAKFILR